MSRYVYRRRTDRARRVSMPVVLLEELTVAITSDIDTREKRASVPGVARPYARGKLPTTIDAAWRQATGLTYAGSTIAAPAGGFVPAYAVNANTLLGGGTA